MTVSIKSICSFLIFAVLSALLFVHGCTSANDEKKMQLIGSFVVTFDPADGSANITPAQNGALKNPTRASLPGNPATLGLDYSDSILWAQGLVDLLDCAPSDWNPLTSVWSFNYKVRRNATDPTKSIVAPLEVRTAGFSDPATGNPVANVVIEINSNIPDAGCNPVRAEIDGAGDPTNATDCDADNNGFFDIMWPDDFPTAPLYLEYADEPGRDFSLLIPSDDNKLDSATSDETGCSFLQFEVNPFNVQPLDAWFDVYGIVDDGTGMPAPTLDPVTTPTNTDATIRVATLWGGPAPPAADRIRVIGGATEITCINGDPCDLDAGAGVQITYPLNTNTTNNVSVFQGNGTDESPATALAIVHDTVAPELAASVPANGAINVSPASNILLTFDGDMEAASATTASLLLYRDGGVGDCSTFGPAVNRTVSAPASNQFLIDPNANMAQNTIHCVVVMGVAVGGTPAGDGTCDGTGEVRDAATNCFATSVIRKFTTSSTDTTPPFVTSTVPPDGANNVSLNTTVQITFNEAMDTSTIDGTSFTLVDEASNPVSGVITFSPDQRTATFTPDADLATNDQHTVTMTTDATDLAGNNLANDFSFLFLTGLAPDTTSPEIVSFLPPDQAANVNENVSPQITFNEPMDPASINTTNIHIERKSDSAPVTSLVTLTQDGLTATIDPLSALGLNTTYLISVEFGCTDVAGNNLAVPRTSEFTTQVVVDTTGPQVTQVTPANNSADVSTYTGVVIRFSEAVDLNTVHTGTFFVEDLKTNPATIVTGSVTLADDKLSATWIQSSPPMSKNQQFRVTVKGGTAGCSDCVKDLAGNPLDMGTPDDFTSVFTTEFQNNVEPFVVLSTPADGSTGVTPRNANIVIQFNEPLQEATVNSTNVIITDLVTMNPITGLLRLLPDGINIRFNSDTDLVASRSYQIDTTNSIKNLAGSRAVPYTATFTTGTFVDACGPFVADPADPAIPDPAVDPCPTPAIPTLTLPGTDPDDGDTDHPRWESIVILFNEALDLSTPIDSHVELVRDLDSSLVPMRIELGTSPAPYYSTMVSINPVTLLNNSESYTVNLKTGIQNLAGFPLQQFTTFNFTTVDTSGDTTAPFISSISPADGAGQGGGPPAHPKDGDVIITFNEHVDPDTLVLGNFTITQQGGGNPPPKGDLSLVFSTVAPWTVTMTPVTNFKNKTTYEVRVTNIVVDDANNSLDCSAGGAGSCDGTDWISEFKTE